MNEFAKLLTVATLAIFSQNTVLERAFGANILAYAARSAGETFRLGFLILGVTAV